MKQQLACALLFSAHFLFSQALFAQNSLSESVVTNIATGDWKLNTFFDYPNYEFLLSTGEGRATLDASEKRLQFVPSNSPEIGFVLSKGIFHIGYRTNIDFLNDRDSAPQSTTSVTDIDFGLRWKHFSVGAFYSRFKGYHVDLNATSGMTVVKDEEGTTITTGESTDGVPDLWERPDMETYNYGLYGNLIIPILGKDSFFNNLDPNIKTFEFWDMGFMGGVGYHRLSIEADAPFVPTARAQFFPDVARLTGVYQHILYTQFTWYNVFHLSPHWSIHFDASAGAEALTHYQRNLDSEDQYDGTTGTRAEITLGFAYQTERHLFGFRHKSTFRMMDKLAATNLDSRFSHTGIEYTLTF